MTKRINENQIVKNKEAKASATKDGRQFGGYRYAELSQVLASILPALNANDLFLAQPVYMEKYSIYLKIPIY